MEENKPITGPELYQMIARKQALRLEILGMKSSRGSAYVLIKKEYGLEGTKDSVMIQFANLIETKRIEFDKSMGITDERR